MLRRELEVRLITKSVFLQNRFRKLICGRNVPTDRRAALRGMQSEMRRRRITTWPINKKIVLTFRDAIMILNLWFDLTLIRTWAAVTPVSTRTEMRIEMEKLWKQTVLKKIYSKPISKIGFEQTLSCRRRQQCVRFLLRFDKPWRTQKTKLK